MESRYSCKSFPAKKLNRRSLAVIVARISMAAATANIFSWQWLVEEIISVLCFFLRHGGIRAQQRIFLNVLRESAAKFA
jgi:hypothetical protein